VATSSQRIVHFERFGVTDYRALWAYQEQLFQASVALKSENRARIAAGEEPIDVKHHLLVCEHFPVYTIGKSGDIENLLLDESALAETGVQFVKTNRGGDITFHGPGQLVAYPILDLDVFFTDIHRYMRLLEETVIQTLAHFGITAGRIQGLTGVWLGTESGEHPRKICAMGVKASRWVTMHGLALNVSTDIDYFHGIVPCGIKDKAVTSLAKELGFDPDFEEVVRIWLREFESVFDCRLQYSATHLTATNR
jgi:lipoyl(octanoyl) transferase